MQESAVKLLFNQGNLKSVTVVNDPMGSGYLLQFGVNNGSMIMIEKQRVIREFLRPYKGQFQQRMTLVSEISELS